MSLHSVSTSGGDPNNGTAQARRHVVSQTARPLVRRGHKQSALCAAARSRRTRSSDASPRPPWACFPSGCNAELPVEPAGRSFPIRPIGGEPTSPWFNRRSRTWETATSGAGTAGIWVRILASMASLLRCVAAQRDPFRPLNPIP